MLIKTSDTKLIQPFIKNLTVPQPQSHKGQNGRVLIIGGSSLFHAASLWAAEVASHFVDIVHYSSTQENEEVFLSLKKKFHNGIIVPQKELPHYLREDDAVLIGPGMMRTGDEATYTYNLTKNLIKDYPDKRFVFDAGSIQVMKPDWLLNLKQKSIITPHQIEFEKLFDVSIHQKPVEEKAGLVQKMAKKYHCIILLKAIVDIISDGEKVYVVEGGNQGLTKGGTGDMLAGLSVSFYAKNDPLTSAILSSILLKRTADSLFNRQGYWYNIDDIIETLPEVLKTLAL